MPLKVTWKKGMKLSTEVFNSLEHSIDESVRLSSLVASGGRYGLFNTIKPFELSVNINNNILEVVSLSCHGITQSGKLIDIDFDSNYETTFDTRISIPTEYNAGPLILVVKISDKDMREVNEMFSEQAYSFLLLGENSPVDKDSLPIGCIVNQFGWRVNESNFVPPCLFVNAHDKYSQILGKIETIYKNISEMCLTAGNCVAKFLVLSIWNSVLDESINLDKECGTLTPGQLFASIQKSIGSFVIGCVIDDYVSLENPEPFIAYLHKPYNARKIYMDIEEGLDLLSEISTKMEAVCKMTNVKEELVEKPKLPEEPKPKGKNKWDGLEI